MYGIEFYETEDGKCPIWDFLEALRLKAPTNKDARILLTFLFIKQQQAHGRPLIAIYRRLVLSFYFICCSFLWVKTELSKASYI